MKKKVDSRIRQTLEDAVRNNHRALFLLVGDRGRDQVVNLHYMLSKMTIQARPNVLWCYKKELGFSSNKKKRMKIIKKRVKQGLVDPNKDDPFELFISSTTIRFAYYNESHKILGNTYGMCVLQDFEALTPNLLARTCETVQGGGLIVLLINQMASLKQLYSLTMDVHSRLRTEAHNRVAGRFNERFILSLSDCKAAIVADDELNVLPISSHVRALSGSTGNAESKPAATAKPDSTSEHSAELRQLKESLMDTPPIGALVEKSKTIDQARALLRFEEAISEKTLRSTIALTAPRGRGKSAALGLAVAAAVAHDYSNIFVTSPSPENLRTFFAFLFVGFDALGFQEHIDYEIIQSTDPEMNKAVVRVNVFRHHRQTVQYLDPTDAPQFLAQAELLVIDEAAAIPLPLVDAMLGPYVVFICSTITGYEGTGRSLSLKLLKKLRDGNAPVGGKQTDQSSGHSNRQDRDAPALTARSGAGRVFREVHMETPIRYSEKDPIEHWLYDLLCLEAGGVRQILTGGAPHPDHCELYYVERDALFSRHRASEAFLHRVISLFVSSHYKNSPNDLQLLSDAPAHALFVLLAPTRSDTEKLPDVLCAIQVCLEGKISSKTSNKQLSRGQRASGDLIPWTISQQFQEPEFATFSGARIVRIATHPDVQKMGYGSRAIRLLMEYFSGNQVSLQAARKREEENEASKDISQTPSCSQNEKAKSTLLSEIIGPRQNIPPLLLRLHERPAESLDYIGVSFGVTHGLFNFWKRLGFLPLYLRLTPNDLTAEHTCIMVSANVSNKEISVSHWLSMFHKDFRKRFIQLLSYDFRKLSSGLAMTILDAKPGTSEVETEEDIVKVVAELRSTFSPYDRRRLESYSRNLVDYHMVIDMVPKLAEMVISDRFNSLEGLRLSPAQTAILMAIGLQRKSIDVLESELGIQASQVLALFNKVMRKIATWIREQEESIIAQGIGPEGSDGVDVAILPKPSAKNLYDDELHDGMKVSHRNNGQEDTPEKKEKGEFNGLDRYKIGGTDKEWLNALPLGRSEKAAPAVVSIKTNKRRKQKHDDTNRTGGCPVDTSKPKKRRQN